MIVTELGKDFSLNTYTFTHTYIFTHIMVYNFDLLLEICSSTQSILLFLVILVNTYFHVSIYKLILFLSLFYTIIFYIYTHAHGVSLMLL